jgi:hypothetical protein
VYFDNLGFYARGLGKSRADRIDRKKGTGMYIGIGTVLVVLLILLLIGVLR